MVVSRYLILAFPLPPPPPPLSLPPPPSPPANNITDTSHYLSKSQGHLLHLTSSYLSSFPLPLKCLIATQTGARKAKKVEEVLI